jgi:hypothetical protein
LLVFVRALYLRWIEGQGAALGRDEWHGEKEGEKEETMHIGILVGGFIEGRDMVVKGQESEAMLI